MPFDATVALKIFPDELSVSVPDGGVATQVAAVAAEKQLLSGL